eukprot:GHVS01035976.1.p1 GENE.GHVS01035976.1~~GHVS01035976.1.p1  ORF type:complete len:151 (+),score=18.20 GHVS01035976.1:341-793(+)
MANKSLYLVDAASEVGDVINYMFVAENMFRKMMTNGGYEFKKSMGGERYAVKRDEDSNRTIFKVLILNGVKELGKLLKEHIAEIRTSLKCDGVRIGTGLTPLGASILVDMPEVTAMNKDTFLVSEVFGDGGGAGKDDFECTIYNGKDDFE